jgi:hypothetical protein
MEIKLEQGCIIMEIKLEQGCTKKKNKVEELPKVHLKEEYIHTTQAKVSPSMIGQINLLQQATFII